MSDIGKLYKPIGDAAIRAGHLLADSFKQAFEPVLSGAWDGGASTRERAKARAALGADHHGGAEG